MSASLQFKGYHSLRSQKGTDLKKDLFYFFRPGELTQNTSFEFEFNQVEKPYECYTGANVRLR